MPVTDGLVGWYAARLETYANNDPVPQFSDRSGVGNHLTTNGAFQPTFKVAPFSHQNAVWFNGNNSFITKNAPSVGTPTGFTIIVVAQVTPGAPEAGIYDIFQMKGGAGGVALQLWLRVENLRRRLYESVGNSIISSYVLGGLPSVCARFKNASLGGTMDLKLFGTLPETQKVAATNPDWGSITLGKSIFSFSGYVYECAIWNRRLTDEEVTAVFSKFSLIYANGILLPASDPPDIAGTVISIAVIDGFVIASWTPPAIACGYVLQYSYDGGAWADFAGGIFQSAGQPSEGDASSYNAGNCEGTPGGDVFQFSQIRMRMLAYNVNGNSAWSAPAYCPPSIVITDLDGSISGGSSIHLNWTGTGESDGFALVEQIVYRRILSGAWVQMAALPWDETVYTDSDPDTADALFNSSMIEYKIVVKSDGGGSPLYGPDSVIKVFNPPAPPAIDPEGRGEVIDPETGRTLNNPES
jgi:hypothetical protein